MHLISALAKIQSYSFAEERMVEFLVEYAISKGWSAWADGHKNVYIVKDVDGTGPALIYPCLAAHIDTVFPIQDTDPTVTVEGDRVVAHRKGKRCGFGGDDKAGVWVCLKVLESTPGPLKVVLFAAEEVGSIGARHANRMFFADVGYFVEFDCPSYGLVSYSCADVALFDGDGVFIRRADPVLARWGYTQWQHHPRTDVLHIRKTQPFGCLNLSCGYYLGHTDEEFIHFGEMAQAARMAKDLLTQLGNTVYAHTGRLSGRFLRPVQPMCVPRPGATELGEPPLEP